MGNRLVHSHQSSFDNATRYADLASVRIHREEADVRHPAAGRTRVRHKAGARLHIELKRRTVYESRP